MKKIALTQRLEQNTAYPELRECLDIRWGELLTRCGYTPCPLPYKAPVDEYITQSGIQGVILTGGNDLSSISPSDESRIRDCYESELLDCCIRKKIPVLGVCRGLQMINCYFGGSSAQVHGHSGTEHEIKHTEAGRFSKLIAEFKSVNSYHNYAPLSSAAGLTTLALSREGHVEAFEHSSMPFLAVMWHPEREDSNRNSDFLKGFFK